MNIAGKPVNRPIKKVESVSSKIYQLIRISLIKKIENANADDPNKNIKALFLKIDIIYFYFLLVNIITFIFPFLVVSRKNVTV